MCRKIKLNTGQIYNLFLIIARSKHLVYRIASIVLHRLQVIYNQLNLVGLQLNLVDVLKFVIYFYYSLVCDICLKMHLRLTYQP